MSAGHAPSIRLVAHEDRQGQFLFVAVPNERGRYLRTDKSVVLVPCPMCKAVKGEPCLKRSGYGSMTHAVRRDRAKQLIGSHSVSPDDVIEPVYPWAPEPDAPPPAEPLPDIKIVLRPKYGPRANSLCLLDEPRPIA